MEGGGVIANRSGPDDGRVARQAAALASALALVLLGPALAPGFALSYDMVFVPEQDLLPWMLGLGGVLPRSVPQDALVAMVTTVVDGAILQKLCLFGILVAAGTGAARVLRDAAPTTRMLAVLFAIWTPFVAERLVLGSWSLLIAYAVLPWAISLARRQRISEGGAAGLILLLFLAAVTPTGGVMVGAVVVAIVVGPGSRASPWRRVGIASMPILANGPWVVPSVLSPAVGLSDPDGALAFVARAEGAWGALITALGTGGVWNAEATPTSRQVALTAAASLCLVVLAVAGATRLRAVLGRWTFLVLGAAAGLGLILAFASASVWLQPAFVWIVSQVPGGGLLRDAQKWLAPYTLFLALAAAVGAERISSRLTDATARGALLVGFAFVPLLALPDAVWGVGGRLSAVSYPSDWGRVRAELTTSDEPGDVIVLPWSSFRRYAWNGGRTVLDPAPRYLPRSTIVDDRLLVRGRDGVVLEVAGEDERSAVVQSELLADRPLAQVAPDIGAGWVVVERGQLPPIPLHALDGAVLRYSGPDLELYRLPGVIAERSLPPHWPFVILVDLVWLGVGLGAGATWAHRRWRSTRGSASGC